MNIQSLIESKANVSVTVSVAELNEFAESVVSRFIERMNLDNKKDDGLCTMKEAAKQVRRTVGTLDRWRKAGYLVPIYVGGKPMYKQSDIDKILGV